jgi:hypothetical protein
MDTKGRHHTYISFVIRFFRCRVSENSEHLTKFKITLITSGAPKGGLPGYSPQAPQNLNLKTEILQILRYQNFYVISTSAEISHGNRLMTSTSETFKNKLMKFKKKKQKDRTL